MFPLDVTTTNLDIYFLLVHFILSFLSTKISIVIGHRVDMTPSLGFRKDSKYIIPHGYSITDKAFLKEWWFTLKEIYHMGLYDFHMQWLGFKIADVNAVQDQCMTKPLPLGNFISAQSFLLLAIKAEPDWYNFH